MAKDRLGFNCTSDEERRIAELEAQLERATDLVRAARQTLFDEDLISAEEFAALVADSEGGKRVARLESYDAIKRELAEARKAATWVSVEDSMPTVIGREFWCWVVPSAGIKTTDETIVRLDFEPHLRAAETYLSKSGGIRFNCGCLEEVTHWMEKPAPPITAPQEEKKAHDHRD